MDYAPSKVLPLQALRVEKHAYEASRLRDQIGARKFVTPAQEKLLVSDLLDALASDYELRGKLSAPVRSHLKHLYDAFGDLSAMRLTEEPERIDRYIIARRNEGAQPATINRATQLLRQSYTLAMRRKHLLSAPFVRHLSEEGNARRGFFEEEQFRAVCARLPQHLADFALYGYLSGWRAGECATQGWDDVEDDVVRLAARLVSYSIIGEKFGCGGWI